MRHLHQITKLALPAVLCASVGVPAVAAEMCVGFGPQTPRDIAQKEGLNERIWSLAGSTKKMNLCNIHTHTNAEHKGPGFTVFAGDGKHGGYQCNETASLTDAELAPAEGGEFAEVKPGDTIEVHWVHSSCEVTPGKGLGSCLSESCANPELRVEAQVFLVVNDTNALDFNDFAYDGNIVIPSDTGEPVVFAGSTTGPSYTEAKCSPLQVTWSVRPQCAKLDINSLIAWGKDNVFKEDHSHGVRQLVKSKELLSPIN